jgi:hypothetical protein
VSIVYASSLDSLRIIFVARFFSDFAQNPGFFGDYRVKGLNEAGHKFLINPKSSEMSRKAGVK